MEQVEEAIRDSQGPRGNVPLLKNPVYHGYFADPFVYRHEGSYYAVGTSGKAGPSTMEFPVLHSTDFEHWHNVGCALVAPPLPGTHYWAPEVAYHDGNFYLYYSVGFGDKGHQLKVAQSPLPSGPFVEVARLLDPEHAEFAIDAHPFQDDDGQWYLFYARDFVDSEGGARPGTALVVTPMQSMTKIGPEYQVVMRARHDWQRYQKDRAIYGGRYDWHTLEGPCVIKHEGRYYCLYSGGNWQDESYGVDFVVADSVMGPYTDTNDGSGPRVLRSIGDRVVGPGHNSSVVGPDGQTYLAYHAWDPMFRQRHMCLDRLSWNDEGPIISHGFDR
jgi:beta-xylosidase